MVISAIIPFPNSIKFTFSSISVSIVYLHLLRTWFVSSNSIWMIIIWLLFSPFVISILLIAYISLVWEDIQKDQFFITSFFIIFILTWAISSLLFNLERIKAAVTILNAIFTSALTIVFLTSLNADLTKLFFSKDILIEANKEGFSSNYLIELFTKLLTLPYVLSAIWALVIIELRSLKIIRR